MIYVAYNDYGDLIAEGGTLEELGHEIERAGYYEDEVFVGRVTP